MVAFGENRMHEQLTSFEGAKSCGVFLGNIFTWVGVGRKLIYAEQPEQVHGGGKCFSIRSAKAHKNI